MPKCIPLGTEQWRQENGWCGETRQSLGGEGVGSGPKSAFTNKFLNLYATSANKAESIA